MSVHQNYIAGEWRASSRASPNINPSNTDELVGEYALADEPDTETAIAAANDTEFGLSAGVDYHVPFGGTKASSYGAREQGSYAAEFHTTVKTAYIRP